MVQIVAEHAGRFNRRYEVRLHDGARVEAVLYRGDSLCVSSQVGCAVGCPFCASGANGFDRNLSTEELVGQVDAVLARGEQVDRVTVSGVGEPLHNQSAVPDFVDHCRERGLGVSITTSGGPLPRLEQWLTTVPHNGITLSVHAGTEAVRAKTVPRGPALDPLFSLLERVVPTISQRRRRRLALAYLLLEGVNDTIDEIDAFIVRARPLGATVHLYAYNPVPTSDQTRASDAQFQTVRRHMLDAGLEVRRSSQARIEANGGCGTLVAVRRPD